MGKFKVPKHYVVADTNALYITDPAHIVSPGFDDKWHECSELASLNLIIPEVVKQELIFQQVFIAQKSRENAQKNLRTIAEVTSTQPPPLKTDPQLKSEVEAVFDKWLSTIGASTVPVPIENVNWKSLIHDATWRNPPFSPPAQAGDNSEKGFRDALVLETLYKIWAQHPEDYVVFITKDTLSQSVVNDKKGKNNKRLVFSTLSELHSHLKLLAKEHDQKFIDAIFTALPNKFFKQNDPECIYYKFNIPALIQKNHALVLSPIIDPKALRSMTTPSLLSSFNTSSELWRPISAEKVFVGPSRYENATAGERFIWKSQLNYVCLYTNEDVFPAQNPSAQPMRRIRNAYFDVVWTSSVSDDAEITDPQLCEIIFAKKEYMVPTLENCIKYNLSGEMGYTVPLPQQST